MRQKCTSTIDSASIMRRVNSVETRRARPYCVICQHVDYPFEARAPLFPLNVVANFSVALRVGRTAEECATDLEAAGCGINRFDMALHVSTARSRGPHPHCALTLRCGGTPEFDGHKAAAQHIDDAACRGSACAKRFRTAWKSYCNVAPRKRSDRETDFGIGC